MKKKKFHKNRMVKKQESCISVWDFTLSKKDCPEGWELKRWLKNNCKRWGFQGEIGTLTGFVHWQGRFSLKNENKVRLAGIRKQFEWPGHLSITSNPNRTGENFYDYCTKDYTAIEGERWTNRDPYIPRQIREVENLYKWQDQIMGINKTWDKDHINVVVAPTGFEGKSTLALWAECHNLGFAVPPVPTMKDMMNILMEVKTQKAYFIDIPRAFKGDWEPEFWVGIECIKRGKIYDLRYKYRQKLIDSPHIWVFMNRMPQCSCITIRRWKLWNIIEGELKQIKNTDRR